MRATVTQPPIRMRLMIARLANIKISTRIALVCLVPLCGLAAVSAANMYDALQRTWSEGQKKITLRRAS